MAILEKEVWVNINNRNITHFRNKGYQVINGKKLLIKIEDVTKGARVKVTKICDSCGTETPNISYGEISISRSKLNGKDFCFECVSPHRGENRKNNMKYEKSLEFWAKESNKEYLVDEFSSKNNKKPSQIARGTKDVYWWNCPDCKSEYDMSLDYRVTSGSNCPFCSGVKVNITNCLATTHPEIAILLKDKQFGYEVSSGMDKKLEFLCHDCGNIEVRTPQQVVLRGFHCKRCGDCFSYPQKFVFSVLMNLGVKFDTEKSFEWSKNVEHENPKLSGNKRYDFYINDYGGIIIESHGRQHYDGSFDKLSGKTLQIEKENDKIKKSIALNNGISNYIELDCSRSNIKYIKTNIEKSKLAEIYDLSKVDWINCNEYATSSLIKVASDHWNSGIKNTTQIGKLMNLHRQTIRRYLYQAMDLGWVNDYNPKEIRIQNAKLSGNNKKEIVQLTLTGDFIKLWKSGVEASKSFNGCGSNISATCRGRHKHAYGFKWMYKTEYDKLQQNELTTCQ